MNALIFDFRRILDANGYRKIVLGTQEGPSYGTIERNSKFDWYLLSPWTTQRPWLIGDGP